MDFEKKSKLDYELTDYGKLLFGYDERQSSDAFYTPAEKRKANYRSPYFYYLISIPIVMIAWFIASIIVAFQHEGDERWLRFALTMVSIIPMAICIFIVVMIAFGLWGKLYAWRYGDAYSNHNSKRNSICIYEDYVVVVRDNVTTVYLRSMLEEFRLTWDYYIEAKFQDGIQTFLVQIPKSPMTSAKLHAIFGKQLRICKAPRIPQSRFFESLDPICWGEFFGALAFAIISAGVGTTVLCLRIYLHVDVPIFLGVAFIGGGVLLLCGAFSFVPFVKDIVMPFTATAFLIYFPWGMVGALHDAWELGKGFKAYTVFSPFSCIAVFVSSLALLFIASGISALKDYILYGHKLDKKKK